MIDGKQGKMSPSFNLRQNKNENSSVRVQSSPSAGGCLVDLKKKRGQKLKTQQRAQNLSLKAKSDSSHCRR